VVAKHLQSVTNLAVRLDEYNEEAYSNCGRSDLNRAGALGFFLGRHEENAVVALKCEASKCSSSKICTPQDEAATSVVGNE
jgi:hypothetical protein